MFPRDSLQARIVYRDPQLIVLDKPTGLLSVPGRGEANRLNLADQVRAAFGWAEVVHRLDRDTSGLLVMALDPESHRRVSRQFELRQVRKRYLAVVQGTMPSSAGEIDLPLSKDWLHPPRYQVDRQQGKPAQTRWRLAEQRHDHARVELEPLTGRSHQLRVHLATIGHPIWGDPLYAPPEVEARSPRLLLHAWQIWLTHPMTQESLHCVASCPF